MPPRLATAAARAASSSAPVGLVGRFRDGRFDAEAVGIDLRRGAEHARDAETVVADAPRAPRRRASGPSMRRARRALAARRARRCAPRSRTTAPARAAASSKRARESRRRRRVDLGVTREQRLEREAPSFEVRQRGDLRRPGLRACARSASAASRNSAARSVTLTEPDRERQEIDGARRALAAAGRASVARCVEHVPGGSVPSRRRRRARSTSRRRRPRAPAPKSAKVRLIAHPPPAVDWARYSRKLA